MYLQQTGRTVRLPSNSLLIAEYLSYLHSTKNSYNVVQHSFCALKWVHDLCPSPPGGNPADTPFSRNIVESSKRVYVKPVNKKEPISPKILERIYHRYAAPDSPLQDLRTALIFVLGFSGLFRANELLDLNDYYGTVNSGGE